MGNGVLITQKCISSGRSTERNIPAAEQPLTRAGGDTDARHRTNTPPANPWDGRRVV
jgi:hypothetical protein